MQESDYGRIAFFSSNVYSMIVGERLAKLQSKKKKKKKASSRTLSRGYWDYH